MDALVAVNVLLAIIFGIASLARLDEEPPILIILVVLFVLSIFTAIGTGIHIYHSPYTRVELANKQIARRYDLMYFAEPVAVFPVKAFKANCVFGTQMAVVFPNPDIEPSPDEILGIIQK